MLKKVITSEKNIRLVFDLKTGGKFRFKKMGNNKNPYNTQLRKDELKDLKANWYLEWMITYYTEAPEKISNKGLLLDPIKIGNRNLYPYELPAIYKKALECSLINRNKTDELVNCICSYEETMEDKFNVISRDCRESNIELNGITFRCFEITIPLLVFENQDGSWIELFLQKQQYAYRIQPYVFLCVPKNLFEFDKEESNTVSWILDENNIEVFINLFRIFASASAKHKEDVCEILKSLKP